MEGGREGRRVVGVVGRGEMLRRHKSRISDIFAEANCSFYSASSRLDYRCQQVFYFTLPVKFTRDICFCSLLVGCKK